MGANKTTSKTTEQSQNTQTPTTPDFALGPVQNYFDGLDNYQRADPYSFNTPLNSLQTGAYQGAGGLFQTDDLYSNAAAATQGVLNATPTPYTAGLSQAQTAPLGQASQAYSTGYSPASLGTAGQAGSAMATAANAGQAQGVSLGGYNAGNLGGAQGYGAQTAGNASLDPNAAQAQSQSLLSGFNNYLNPATDALVNTTMADFDADAAQTRARQQGQAAGAGAFGGSRYGIAQAATEGELSRARASTGAGLRNQAFNAAAGLSQSDTANRQQTSLFNAGAQNQRAEFGAGLTAANNQFNAQQGNQAASQLAGAQNQFGLARFGAQNDAARFGAESANQGSLFNAGAQNQFGLANAGFAQDANLANANAQNQNAQFNTGQNNAFGLAQYGAQNDANQFGAGAQNTASLANMQAANQYGLEGFNAQNQLSQFNAGQANDLNQFNAAQANTAQQNQTQNQLQGAGLLSDIGSAYGGNYRADLGMQNDLGNSLYGFEDRYAQAPLTQLQNYGNLLNPGLINTLQSQTNTGFNTGQNVSTQKPSLFNQLLAAGSVAASFSDRRLKRDPR